MAPSNRPKCAAPGCMKRAVRGGKYCSVRCRNRMAWRRHAERERLQQATAPVHAALRAVVGPDTDDVVTEFLARRSDHAALNVTGGPAYDDIIGQVQVLDGLLRGTMSYRTASEITGYGISTIAKVLEEFTCRLRTQREAAAWTMGDDAARLVARHLNLTLEPARYRAMTEAAFEALIDELVALFVEWRNRFCTDERGQLYVTKGFHRRWIRALIKALLLGRRIMVLSPPRHGKTQLLIDFCTWLIVALPNIRLLWVAANGDLAGDWLAAIEDQLDNNETLRVAYLEPGTNWRPPARSGKAWSRKQFTVATRTITGVKSPTMQAVGRGGRILSRDVDFMIVDDIEDDESVATPGGRISTRKWFTVTAGGRKMEHTGVAVLGSRQDPDDLYGYLIDNSEWECQVEEAHSSACRLDPFDEEAHVDCMLMPEVRSYRWLQGQRRSMALEGGDEMFDMQYLNKAIPKGLEVFSEAQMRLCLNRARRCGEYPAGSRLVAGLDPSPTSHQSAFLWAWYPEWGRLFMVDSINDTGPGIPGFLELLKLWTVTYPTLSHWVVEDVGFQAGYLLDEGVQRYRNENGLSIEGHQTQTNKWHRDYGVGAMAKLFSTKVNVEDADGIVTTPWLVDLPYGDPATVEKVERYIRQARNFASTAAIVRARTRAGYRTDELMASWFPMKLIRSWRTEEMVEMQYVGYEPSFPSFTRTTWDRVPWR